jgi:hypothetical protein
MLFYAFVLLRAEIVETDFFFFCLRYKSTLNKWVQRHKLLLCRWALKIMQFLINLNGISRLWNFKMKRTRDCILPGTLSLTVNEPVSHPLYSMLTEKKKHVVWRINERCIILLCKLSARYWSVTITVYNTQRCSCGLERASWRQLFHWPRVPLMACQTWQSRAV